MPAAVRVWTMSPQNWVCPNDGHAGFSATLAAMTHVAAATQNLSFDCDTHYPWTGVDVFEGEPFIFRGGNLNLPNGPGLGVSLDRQKVDELAALYHDCALKERDDTAYMKRFDPTYERRVPRW